MDPVKELRRGEDEDKGLHQKIHNICEEIKDILDLIAEYKKTPDVVMGEDDWNMLRRDLRKQLIAMENFHQAIKQRLNFLQYHLQVKSQTHTTAHSMQKYGMQDDGTNTQTGNDEATETESDEGDNGDANDVHPDLMNVVESDSTVSSHDNTWDNTDVNDRIIAKFNVGDAVFWPEDPASISKNLARVWFVDAKTYDGFHDEWSVRIVRKRANIWIDGKTIEIGHQYNDDFDASEGEVVNQDQVEPIV